MPVPWPSSDRARRPVFYRSAGCGTVGVVAAKAEVRSPLRSAASALALLLLGLVALIVRSYQLEWIFPPDGSVRIEPYDGAYHARRAFGDLQYWVWAVRNSTERPIGCYPHCCRWVCRDECMALSVVSALQHGAGDVA